MTMTARPETSYPGAPATASHRAPSPERQAGLMCRQRLAPFIPISAPTLPSLGPPPPSRRGKHGLQVSSAHFDAPTPATRLHHENLAGPLICPRFSCYASRGWSPRAPALSRPLWLSGAAPSQVVTARRSPTPLPPFGIGPPDHPYVPLVICGRHDSTAAKDPP